MKQRGSRSRPRKAAPVGMDARLELRVSTEAKDMLEAKAKARGITPGALHRQVLYKYLGLITEEI